MHKTLIFTDIIVKKPDCQKNPVSTVHGKWRYIFPNSRKIQLTRFKRQMKFHTFVYEKHHHLHKQSQYLHRQQVSSWMSIQRTVQPH